MKNEINLKGSGRTVLFISAHPDDPEFRGCGLAALCSKRGDTVFIMSVTDGSGGHMIMGKREVAERREREARNSAAIIGATALCMGAPDGCLEPSLKYREELIRIIRKIEPDIIVTNRLNDYHPDHRYTAQLIQDASYMLMVPNVVSDTPALKYNPMVLYWGDSFTKPQPFSPDIVLSIDDVIEDKLAMLYEHESQLFEWLPYTAGEYDRVPPKADIEGRKEWIRYMYDKRIIHKFADMFRNQLIERYGKEKGTAVKECEAYEICEYGYIPNKEELDLIFKGM